MSDVGGDEMQADLIDLSEDEYEMGVERHVGIMMLPYKELCSIDMTDVAI